MPNGRVLYSQDGRLHMLRYVGEIRYPVVASIDRLVKTLLEDNAIDDLVVDLTETDSIDSTNLGELARLAQSMRERGSRRPVIISPQLAISQLLRSMSLDEVFDLTADGTVSGGVEIPPGPNATMKELSTLMIVAHKSLANMGERNRRKFCDVIALMEKELDETAGNS